MAVFEPHPIAELAAHLFEDDGDQVVLRPDCRRALEDAVDGFVRNETPELMHVVQTLFSFADWLEDERQAPGAANAVCEILDRPHVVEAMQRINDRAVEAASAQKAEFMSFSAQPAPSAPGVDDRPPDDAVKAGSLDFPKRM